MTSDNPPPGGSGGMTPQQALERLVIHTAMEDAQVAAECEAVLLPLLAANLVGEGWQTMDTAPRDVPILASTTGKVWFQTEWDDDDGWYTFNQYLERDAKQPDRKYAPMFWIPIPRTTP